MVRKCCEKMIEVGMVIDGVMPIMFSFYDSLLEIC